MPPLANPNLEPVPDFRTAEFEIICNGLRMAYNETEDQVVERLIAAWQAARANRIAAWEAHVEEEARIAEEAECEHQQQQELEERTAVVLVEIDQ